MDCYFRQQQIPTLKRNGSYIKMDCFLEPVQIPTFARVMHIYVFQEVLNTVMIVNVMSLRLCGRYELSPIIAGRASAFIVFISSHAE